ncbi:hypothetical protein D918_09866 [Trichuris suis]|nr:hypothetical protein D918_09866 [Trichuris suis]
MVQLRRNRPHGTPVSFSCSTIGERAPLGVGAAPMEGRTGPVSYPVTEPCSEAVMTVAHMQSHSAVKVLGYISGHQTELTIDTGAAVSLMDYALFNNVQPSELTDVRSIRVLTATGNEMKIAGTSVVEVSIGGAPAVRRTVLVAQGLASPCLVGADFLRSHKCVIDFASGTLHINDYEVKLKSERRNEHIIATTDSASQDSITHEVIKTMCADSTADEGTQQQLREMVLRYKDVISMANDEIGRTSVDAASLPADHANFD